METKVVLLTGASAGIGLAAATLLMNSGVKVYGASRRGGENVKAKSGNGEIINVVMDVNNEAEIKAVVDRIIKENNKLDAVISNAGNGISGSVEDTTSEEVKYQMETNFFGAIKTIQACLPVFRKQGYGKIITVSSLAAVIPVPYQAIYSAGKAGLSKFMQALSIEVKPFGIQCSTILPGDTKTEFTAARKYTTQSTNPNSAYYERTKISVSKMEKEEQNGMKPEVIGQAIVDQVMRKKVQTVIIPGFQYQVFNFLFKILPTKTSVWIVGQIL
jgi:short-subunit dehydrogenase